MTTPTPLQPPSGRRSLRPTGLRAGTAACVLVIGLAIPGCGDDRASPKEPGIYGMAATGLCQAAEDAARGSADTARRGFYDTAHQPLHELAADTAAADRTAAAELLEAKEAVEAGLDSEAGDLADRLGALLTATSRALAAIDHPAVACLDAA